MAGRKGGSGLMTWMVTLLGVTIACLAGIHVLNIDLEPVGLQGRGLMGLMVTLLKLQPLPSLRPSVSCCCSIFVAPGQGWV